MEVHADTTTSNLAEETNVTKKPRILDSLKNKWHYFHNKFMNLVACTTNTGGNNNIKESIITHEEQEHTLVVETNVDHIDTVIEEAPLQLPEEPVSQPTPEVVNEEPVSEPTPEVVVDEYLPVAIPVVIEEPITLQDRI